MNNFVQFVFNNFTEALNLLLQTVIKVFISNHNRPFLNTFKIAVVLLCILFFGHFVVTKCYLLLKCYPLLNLCVLFLNLFHQVTGISCKSAWPGITWLGIYIPLLILSKYTHYHHLRNWQEILTPAKARETFLLQRQVWTLHLVLLHKTKALSLKLPGIVSCRLNLGGTCPANSKCQTEEKWKLNNLYIFKMWMNDL